MRGEEGEKQVTFSTLSSLVVALNRWTDDVVRRLTIESSLNLYFKLRN